MPSENQDGTTENDGFVSGVLKLKNNNTSPVKVSVASFAKKADSGELEIVDPDSCNWEDAEEESMKKMALGLYVKEGTLTGSNYKAKVIHYGYQQINNVMIQLSGFSRRFTRTKFKNWNN